jgi:hypothetical protein
MRSLASSRSLIVDVYDMMYLHWFAGDDRRTSIGV